MSTELYASISGDNTVYNAEGNNFSVFPGPGIVENNVISAITVETDKNGKKYLKFTFKNLDTDATISLMEFPVEDPSGTKTKEEMLKKINSQMTRLKHIVTKFYPAQLPAPWLTFESLRNGLTSFEDLANRIISILPPQALAAKKFRLFVHYNYNNHLSFPPFVPFMEDAAVNVADSKFVEQINKTLKAGTVYKMEKDKKPTDSANTLADMSPNAATFQIPGAAKADDLPF